MKSLSRRREILLDFCLLFIFAAGLIRPLFKARYLDKWASIESTFIADARFLAERWPHPQWQPLWYGGTRFDYVYPPALRYGTALIAKVTGYWPVKAYHAFTAFFYCVGIAGVYLLVRAGTGSRGMAWLCGLMTALMSPSLLFLTNTRHDAWKLTPVRLGVLTRYGEGPHMTALALIPIALTFAWWALERRRPAAIGLAALFLAAVVSTNFYGATALVVFYPTLVWSFWITRQDRRILVPAIAMPLLGYGLMAFWFVPSYVRLTLENMKYIPGHGNTTWSIWFAVAVAVGFALASDRFGRGRPERTWGVFVAGLTVFCSLYVLGNYYFGFQISGDANRLVPELDLVLILSAATVLRWLWNKPGLAPRAAAAVVVVAAFATTAGYVRHAWHVFPLWPNYQNRIEYKISEWIWKNMPEARTLPIGSVRFWFDTWHDLAQLGGGSDQGLLNGMVEVAQWEVIWGQKPEPGVLWMQSFGVDAAYVSDQRSEEIYKDHQYPQKFAGTLPVLYDDHEGNWIYGVPRRYPALVRVVDTQKRNALQSPRSGEDLEYLQAYVDVIEKGPDAPVALTWQGSDEMRVRARVGPGQSIIVQESFDPAWHAWSGGKQLEVRKDVLGLMTIDPPPGDQEIRIAFVTPLENRVGRIVTAFTILMIVVSIVVDLRRKQGA